MSNKVSVKIRQLPKHYKRGTIHFEGGRNLKPHEFDTVEKLLRFGFDVVCKKESNTPYQNTADIVWKNEIWELKFSKADGKYTVNNRLRKGKKQSANIVLDISQSSKPIDRIIGSVQDFTKRHKSVKKVMVIYREKYCIIDRSAL